MIGLVLLVYGFGFLVTVVFYRLGEGQEPTAHGRSILRVIGFSLALFWPVVLVWFLGISPYLLWRRLQGRKT